MEITGEYRMPAPPEAVWRAMTDPEVLRRSLPGCDRVLRHSETEFSAEFAVRLGPIRPSFSGRLTIADSEAPERYTLVAEGSNRLAGHARGTAQVRLRPEGAATILHYVATVELGGRLVQLGARLLEGTAHALADRFFARFIAAMQAVEAERPEGPTG
ncbi:MAG TPA: carbon monoxide dehydrogenase subunit G [Alphaproteobacteria bacterium]|nr:carbon monoxide dehydrogenase subunit G [Alphaproteobacteria bacterium]